MTPTRSFPGWLILMGLLTAIGPLAIDMYLPAFPSITRALMSNDGAVELTLSVYLVGIALGQLVYGPLSDRFGRKPPLYVGLTLFALGSIACVLAPNVEWLTGARFFQALGGSACMVIPRAVIRDHYDTQAAARALSLLMLVMGVAPILAPIVGGQILLLWDYRGIFVLLALIALGLGLAVYYGMQETVDRARAAPVSWGSIFRNYGGLLTHRSFLAFALAGGMGSGCLFSYIVGSPHVFIEGYGVSEQMYGALFAINATGLIIASQVNAKLLRTVPVMRLLRVSLWMLPLAGLTAFLATAVAVMFGVQLPLWVLMACLLLFMVSLAFIGPNTAALGLSDQSHRLGTASALLGTLQFLCGTLASMMVGLLREYGILSFTGVIATCSVLGCVAGLTGLRWLRAPASARPA